MSVKYVALIIDDNWYNGDVFRLALENVDYEVLYASDGPTGLQMLEEHDVNLLVLDLAMPEMRGEDVLIIIRNDPRFEALPVAVVTANPYMAEGNVALMADYVMYKPIHIVAFSHFADRLKRRFNV